MYASQYKSVVKEEPENNKDKEEVVDNCSQTDNNLREQVKKLQKTLRDTDVEADYWHNKYTEIINITTDYISEIVPEFKREETAEDPDEEAEHWHNRYSIMVNKASEFISIITPHLKRKKICHH